MQDGDSPPLDIVVAAGSGSNEVESVEVLLASVLGLPVVKPSWLDECQTKQAVVSMDSHLTLKKRGQPWKKFEGLTACICGLPLQGKIKALLQFAGMILSELYIALERCASFFSKAARLPCTCYKDMQILLAFLNGR